MEKTLSLFLFMRGNGKSRQSIPIIRGNGKDSQAIPVH